MQMQAGEPINDVPQIQRSPVSDEPPPKRQKAAESGTVGAAVRGRLPGRVVLDAKLDTARGAHSVVAAKGRLHLLLDDASLGLRWLDADAAEGHFREHRAGVEAAAAGAQKLMAETEKVPSAAASSNAAGKRKAEDMGEMNGAKRPKGEEEDDVVILD